MPKEASRDAALLHLAELLRQEGYHFVTPTPATHARVNARPGNEWAGDLAGVFGWSRRFGDGVLPPPMMVAMQEAGVLTQDGDAWRSQVRVSTLGNELFLHSAYPTDALDAVFFGPDTYRFGAAILAELERRSLPVRRAVDVGCGAGPGAVLVARAHPAAEVLGVDINPAALRLTAVNARLAGLDNVQARRSDILSGVDGVFDLIVSNPPYLVDPAERAYRHGGGPLGASLSLRILDAALDRLAPGGTVILYTGAAVVNGRDPFQDAVSRRCRAHGVTWAYRELDPDVFGEELDTEAYGKTDRIAAVVLTASKNG